MKKFTVRSISILKRRSDGQLERMGVLGTFSGKKLLGIGVNGEEVEVIDDKPHLKGWQIQDPKLYRVLNTNYEFYYGRPCHNTYGRNLSFNNKRRIYS